MPRNEVELRVQKTFIDWCWANWHRWPEVAIEIPRRIRQGRHTIEIKAKSVPFFHPANGEVRDARTGAKLNAQGLRKGILDLWLPVPNKEGFCGLVIEVKQPGGYTSPNQKNWLAFLERMGWKTAVCKSFTECVDATTSYLDAR